MAQRDLPNFLDNVFYVLAKFFLRIGAIIGYRLRCHDMHKMKIPGRGLICGNHQSNLDPMLLGLACDRDVHYLAKKSLFKKPPLKYMQHALHCIAIDRKMGIAGIKSTIRRLKAEKLVLMFPEGTRSKDGKMNEFKSGFLTIARKTRSPLIPMGLEGAYEAYPPGQMFPRPGYVHVVFGEPIMPEEYAEMEDDEVVKVLEERVRACVAKAAQKREHHMSLNIRNRKPPMRLSTPVEPN